jgi:quinol monooxygenase YgiN
MYGSIARMRVKPGAIDEIIGASKEWERTHGMNIDGFVASYVYQMDQDSNECWLVAIFEDRESYRANAERPEQDEWYQTMRAYLEEDPEWHDGEVIHSIIGAKPEPTI